MKRFLLGLLAHAATALVTWGIVIVYLGCGMADIIVHSIEVPANSMFSEHREGVFISQWSVAARGKDKSLISLSAFNDEPVIILSDSDGHDFSIDLSTVRKRRGI